MLPSDFDIFSPSTNRCSTCTQKRANCDLRGALALRDLVFVVRKDQVDAAGMDVDRRLAEQPQRHRGALDVPAGAAGAGAEVP